MRLCLLFIVCLMRHVSRAGLPRLCGNGEEALQRLCRVWECKSFPRSLFSTAEVFSDFLNQTVDFPAPHPPHRKSAGCAMAQVSATEAIAAITAVAGAEKSEWQPAMIGAAPETSSHLTKNMIVVPAAATVTDRDPPSAVCVMESNSFWST